MKGTDALQRLKAVPRYQRAHPHGGTQEVSISKDPTQTLEIR